jgi:hypothetical protein
VSLREGAMLFQMEVDLSVKQLDRNELMRRVCFLLSRELAFFKNADRLPEFENFECFSEAVI